ncbi:MAG TPA: 2-isopropylmalate synthase [Candidatus Sumerlaeota bacterium]|nr:2-isopropylmalate synthase [Candidatus Sumerlaeota bacterium]HPK03296.1 2-isopropylmalate synthase [Candidatus Sumerlaeota bacterium]
MTQQPAPQRVVIFDTTLRDGEQSPGFSMNLQEKLELAHQLARLGVDVIEAGFPITSPGDFEAVHAIAGQVHGPVICALARAVEKDILRAGEALAPAARKRIHTFIATSNIHVEKKLRMSREQVIETAFNAVKLARSFTDDVEFSCEDAGRTDWDYIVAVLTAAIEAGATTLNVPDTVGYTVPEQFGQCIRYVREHTPGIENCIISVHCHNDLGHAVANSLAGVRNGARQIECTINGIGERAGNTSLEEAVMMLHVRKDYWGLETGIRTEEIYRTSRLLSRITGVRVQPNKAIVGANAFAHEAGIHQDGVIKERTTYEIMHPADVGWLGEGMVMGKHSGRAALAARLEQLGIKGLSPEDITAAYERFKKLCDQKKTVYDEDLLAIVEDQVSLQRAIYRLVDLEASTSMRGGPRVRVAIAVGDAGEQHEALCTEGDGQVDALYRALDQLTPHTIKLLEYGIESVTEGKDALGRVMVKMNIDGDEVRGTGVATDVIVASAHAYLNALNRFEMLKEISERAASTATP